MSAVSGFPETFALCLTALSVGAIHTLLGPDHYVPFAAMARAGNWSTTKTLLVTGACGLGHVAGSVIIGLAGLALGVAVMRVEGFETIRGDVAGWLMIGLGLAYVAWGFLPAHGHDHATGESGAASVWTPWLLFLVFVFGPCEPLIPLLIYPAARASPLAVATVVTAFAMATVATMTVAVIAIRSGIALLPGARLHRFAHVFAGLAILGCGLLIKVGL